MAKNPLYTGFYRLDLADRFRLLKETTNQDAHALHHLEASIGNQMIENYLFNYELPFGIAPNFTINHKDYLIPLAIEEPSVIAALSNAAKLVDSITTSYGQRLITGQIIFANLDIQVEGRKIIQAHQEELLALAKEASPSMVSRGGGPTEIWSKQVNQAGDNFFTVYLSFNPCDAMGANAINTVLENLAPRLTELLGQAPLMSILSNYSEQALATAEVIIPVERLATDSLKGQIVAEKIVVATSYANLDIYRATTHNKGIMNGIDGLALATGNDWRAIEAASHAYASRKGGYRAMSEWQLDGSDLKGRLSLPLPVATVGGTLSIQPQAQWALSLLGQPSASQLAEIMVAVGLIQNLAALKALVTEGIQKGHMRMQARSLALQVGASVEELPELVDYLIKQSFMNRQKAHEGLELIRKL
ncbi:hydroxymethylglutaryl-CoA reductase, degradative [Eremococcus coleocola]|uniref:hydroxymethylglutaryl-CoA reductase, degradative n=1 Tax=Eremococcus coleocola TaxID=88132 RepID=UPI000401296E|nr:hydroxymethylglutaryl-CoA reductase, degradative [Eremococcus coleocola]